MAALPISLQQHVLQLLLYFMSLYLTCCVLPKFKFTITLMHRVSLFRVAYLLGYGAEMLLMHISRVRKKFAARGGKMT